MYQKFANSHKNITDIQNKFPVITCKLDIQHRQILQLRHKNQTPVWVFYFCHDWHWVGFASGTKIVLKY